MAQNHQQLDHLRIPLEDIILATNNFAEDIGKGGFGSVYKGQLAHSNSSGEPSMTVAVKRLQNMYGQGEHEFLTEIIMLANCKHSNYLVSLVGFCDEGGEKIVVYKYEINGSLDRHLDSMDLTWEQRLRICLGAARGLEYLHAGVGTSHRILHRDIKSANILLDENWEAKISDFGLSKIGPMNQPITILATRPCGTLGYVDPQYQKTGVLTKESDVYSFGVVLFEVLCGKPASLIYEYDGESTFFIKYVKRRYEEGKIDEIIMPNLREQINPYSLQTFSGIAYQCLNKNRNQRPSMNRIVQELQSIVNQVGSPTRLWGSSTNGFPWLLLLDNNQKLRTITIDHKDWIISIGFTVEDDLSGTLISSHHGVPGGQNGGKSSEISFDEDEEIIEIVGTVNGFPVISSLSIVTNKRRHGPFGLEAGTSFSVAWDFGAFAGFYGRAGGCLDGLGFYSNKCLYERRSQHQSMKCSDQESQSIDYQMGLPTELWGSSTGGSPWSLLLDNNQKLRKITIDHKDWIFSIGFTVEDLSNGSLVTSQHGGINSSGGAEHSEIIFDVDEEIIEIVGTVNGFPVISSLCIVTNKRRHGPIGPKIGACFSVTWVVGVFAGFYGRAGSYLDGLGFYSKKCLDESQNQRRPSMNCNLQRTQSIDYHIGLPTELWGSSIGGSPWSMPLDNNQKLRKIRIDHKDWIFSIGFTVEDLGNGSLVSSQHGGIGGRSGTQLSEITFDADEEIIEIIGTVNDFPVISSLCIVTNKSRHGPIGPETGSCFSVTWFVGAFGGFYGRAGCYLDGLGFYSKKDVI